MAKSDTLQLRISPAQKTQLRRQARQAQMDMSTWVLTRLFPPAAARWTAIVARLAHSDAPRFVLAELHDLLAGLTAAELTHATAAAPPRLSPFLANYVAAMVEYRAHQCAVPPPRWTESVPPLPTPHFGSDLLSLRLHLLFAAPPPFRNRGLFVDASVGARV